VRSTARGFDPAGDDVGARLRSSRREQGLSLQQPEVRADVSASFRSQIVYAPGAMSAPGGELVSRTGHE
jgi:hypothetical protein